MANETTTTKYKSKAVKFTGVILLILVLLLGSYIAATVAVKASITQNLTPLISRLQQTYGADRISVTISADPGDYGLPTDLHFHVFLKLEYNSLSSLSDSTIKKILTNDGKEHEVDYSYDWDKLDYAAYTYTTSDAVLGKIHPVFLTVTDGDTSRMLFRQSYSKLTVSTGDAYRKLSPPAVHPIITIIGVITAFFLLIYILCLKKQSKKRKELEAERRQQLAIAKAHDRTFGLQYILGEIEDEFAQAEAVRSKSNNKSAMKVLLIVAACVILAGILAVTLYLVPNSRYNEAMALKNAGNADEAYPIFQSLGNFKDARDICNSYDYDAAITLLDNGKYGAAYYRLKAISGYDQAEQKAAALLTQYPHLSILDAKEGDEITLGSYEQDNVLNNGKEPLQWVVLKNNNGIVYAVSRDILDVKSYNTSTSDGTTLLPWLRTQFYGMAFPELGDGFISKVGLLTREDISAYLNRIDRTPDWTAYAMAQGPEKHSYSGYSWWLEGDYFHGSSGTLMDVVIESGGYSNYSSKLTSKNGVRPTILIDCTGADKDYYAVQEEEASSAAAEATPATGAASTNKTNSSNKTNSNAGKTKCTRCNGTGKVVLHYGNSWNQKEGYRYGEKCGGCGGTGYK